MTLLQNKKNSTKKMFLVLQYTCFRMRNDSCTYANFENSSESQHVRFQWKFFHPTFTNRIQYENLMRF